MTELEKFIQSQAAVNEETLRQLKALSARDPGKEFRYTEGNVSSPSVETVYPTLATKVLPVSSGIVPNRAAAIIATTNIDVQMVRVFYGARLQGTTAATVLSNSILAVDFAKTQNGFPRDFSQTCFIPPKYATISVSQSLVDGTITSAGQAIWEAEFPLRHRFLRFWFSTGSFAEFSTSIATNFTSPFSSFVASFMGN